MIQRETMKYICLTLKRNKNARKIYVGVQEEKIRENREKALFQEEMTENIPELEKHIFLKLMG